MRIPAKVRPGDPFTPAVWNEMVDSITMLQPRPGSRTFIRQTGSGFSVDYLPAPPLDHPFRATLGAKGVTLTSGYVNNIMPKIGGSAISGVDKDGKPISSGAPSLSLGSVQGKVWVMLKVTIDNTGAIKNAEIVKSDEPLTTISPTEGQTPICLVTGGTNPQIYQIVYHNLGHSWLKPSLGLGRHFFWAA